MTAAATDKKYFRALSSSGKASILVRVEVVDTRSQFGRVDALIRPVDGEGEMWVSLDSLTADRPPRRGQRREVAMNAGAKYEPRLAKPICAITKFFCGRAINMPKSVIISVFGRIMILSGLRSP